MRTLSTSRLHDRQLAARRRAALRGTQRREFLRLERLENRYALSGASPGAVNDLYQTMVDQPLDVAAPAGILANDTDTESDPLAAGMFSEPSHGTVTLNEDGSFQYTPEAGFVGMDSFMYFANDGTGDSLLAAVTIRVEEPGAAPVAANDAYTTLEDGPLTIDAAGGILANDSDADGDTMTPTVISQPQHGMLTVNGDGSFSYTPEANFNGLDGFSYFVNDGSLDSNVAGVTLTVTSVNDDPTAVNDELTTAEDTPLEVVAPGVLGNDTDVDGDALSSVLVAAPQHGTVTLNADGSLLYTPDADFNGIDGFSYTAGDGSAESDVASVTITVTPAADAPIGVGDSYTVDEDAVLTVDAAGGVLVNDTDADGEALSAALVSGPASGTLTLNADGSFSYTPNSNFSGSDSFVYTAGDGSLVSGPTTVSITVNPTNDAPAAGNDEFTTAEDTPLEIAAPGVLGNDTDPEGDPLTVAILAPPANGTVTLNADGGFTYTPNADFNGVDGFSYVASDGTLSSEAASVTINVTSANDGPIGVSDSYTTDEDTPLSVGATGGLLSNDTDADGDPLTAALVSGPTNGTLTLNADGTFNYTPNSGFSGSDSFTYTVSDGTESSTATASITVNPVNDAPIAVDDALSVNEDETLNLAAPGILGNDSDPEGDPLTAALVAGPTNGTLTMNADGSLSYTPNAGFSGADSFTYTVSDGTLTSTATAAITVNATNDAPVATDDELHVEENQTLTLAAPGIMANDSDPDGDPLSAALVAGPASGTLTMNADGSLSYTPNADFNGSDSFTYTVSDGVLTSNIATVSIDICADNSAPTAADDTWAIDENAVLTVDAPGVLGNDSDPEGDALSAAIVTGPANGTVTVNADGSFVYTPNADFSGTDTFVYAASDGTDSDDATVTITVNPQADAPTAAIDNYSTGEDLPLTVGADMGVLANDLDPSGGGLTAEVVDGPSHGTLTLNSDGSFSYTPEANWNGTDSFTYKAISGGEEIVSQANIVVEALNDSPVAGDDELNVDADGNVIDDGGGSQDGSAGITLMANDSDIDSESLTATLVEGPEHGTLVLSADGTFTYVPEAGYEGDDTFRYQLYDGMANSNVATVTLHVAGPSQAPLPPAAVDDVFTMTADDVLEVASPGVLENDTAAEGEELTSEVVTGPEHGTVALDANGGFVYTPEAGFVGSDTFTYQAVGSAGPSNVATVSITIEAAANQRPEAINDSYSMTAGTTLEITADLGLLLNDTDPEGSALIASLFSGPLNGSLTMNDDGSFTYTPNEGFTGLDSFLYRVSDGELLSALGAVTIHVNPLDTDEEPAPIPAPEPEPGHCLAMDDDLLDQIMAEGEDPAAIDDVMSKQDFLA